MALTVLARSSVARQGLCRGFRTSAVARSAGHDHVHVSLGLVRAHIVFDLFRSPPLLPGLPTRRRRSLSAPRSASSLPLASPFLSSRLFTSCTCVSILPRTNRLISFVGRSPLAHPTRFIEQLHSLQLRCITARGNRVRHLWRTTFGTAARSKPCKSL